MNLRPILDAITRAAGQSRRKTIGDYTGLELGKALLTVPGEVATKQSERWG